VGRADRTPGPVDRMPGPVDRMPGPVDRMDRRPGVAGTGRGADRGRVGPAVGSGLAADRDRAGPWVDSGLAADRSRAGPVGPGAGSGPAADRGRAGLAAGLAPAADRGRVGPGAGTDRGSDPDLAEGSHRVARAPGPEMSPAARSPALHIAGRAAAAARGCRVWTTRTSFRARAESEGNPRAVWCRPGPEPPGVADCRRRRADRHHADRRRCPAGAARAPTATTGSALQPRPDRPAGAGRRSGHGSRRSHLAQKSRGGHPGWPGRVPGPPEHAGRRRC
jgi:hypothetical protein